MLKRLVNTLGILCLLITLTPVLVFAYCAVQEIPRYPVGTGVYCGQGTPTLKEGFTIITTAPCDAVASGAGYIHYTIGPAAGGGGGGGGDAFSTESFTCIVFY